MDYLKLFVVNGVFGFYLQSIGYVLMIWAFGHRKLLAKDFFLSTVVFSILAFGIRSLDMISFGFHTILIMILFILIGTKIFKNKVYSTALAVMVTAILVIICEILNYGFLHIWFDTDTISQLMKNDNLINDKINKAFLGIPTNLILLLVAFVIYKFQTRKKRVN